LKINKILGVYECDQEKNSDLNSIFEQENISVSVSSAIVASSSKITEFQMTTLLAACIVRIQPKYSFEEY